MHNIEFSNQALKDLKKIPKNYIATILSKLDMLALDPHGKHNNATRLKGEKIFRLRIGDYRVIYELHNKQLVIEVIKVGSRGGVYD